jgi:hypothetical protein
MKGRTILILASALLAGSLLATDAQARGGGGGGGGGHGGGFGGGGFGGGHIGGGFGGDHIGTGVGGDHIGTGVGGDHIGGRIGSGDALMSGVGGTDSRGLGSGQHMGHHGAGYRFGYGAYGLDDDDGIYDDGYADGLGCSNYSYLHLHHQWSPSCS